jgi:hypothetical protein
MAFILQSVMNELGLFLQSKLGKRRGDWIEDPDVEKVFDQVVAALKGGLSSE